MNKWYKTLSIYALIFLFVIVMAYFFMDSQSEQEIKEVEFSEFVTELRNENVEELTLQETDMQGTLKNGDIIHAYAPSSLQLMVINNDLVMPQVYDGKLVVTSEPPKTTPWYVSMLPYLLTIVIFVVIWMVFMNSSQGGAGKAMSFGKSRARMYKSDGKKVTFSDVAGLEEEKEELQEIVDFLRRPKKYTALGARIPKGVLLVGPPGTGKTFVTKAVSGEAGVPFFSISGSDFVEMFVGVGASRVRDPVSYTHLEAYMEKFSFNLALEEIWKLIRRTNKYIDETAPWILAKDETSKSRLDTVMHHLAESIRVISVLIHPFLHNTSEKIRIQLGIAEEEVRWQDAGHFDLMEGKKVRRGDPIFPRLDIEKEIAELEAMTAASMAEAKAKAEKDAANVPAEKKGSPEIKPEITIEDFEKIDLRVGEVVACEKHPKADKLLVFQVRIGDEVRQIVSGVAKYYKPEEMPGKHVIVVANLKSIRLRGQESRGMILFADSGERLEIVTTEAPDGNQVK